MGCAGRTYQRPVGVELGRLTDCCAASARGYLRPAALVPASHGPVCNPRIESSIEDGLPPIPAKAASKVENQLARDALRCVAAAGPVTEHG
eukprot:CAMPEP_0181168296 /NCGR_PEP_ID=MMETSP1096-20121128/196_1 /TAXON_ID=156174 ORGANISM="Chrysochromulina ericina, Strain CCMP281" /NCGR_SAMPLE_ID=MMETSP1096 /ASSEMBLY_ACC=CAM_ASM_000453 /LENGTH=90 /DNA_ID=CAMNT_0023255659 /DNA_START=842 /DNA_END=1114 /DNA_ORIENTATION=-